MEGWAKFVTPLQDFVRDNEASRMHVRTSIQFLQNPVLLVPVDAGSVELSMILIDAHLGDANETGEEIIFQNGSSAKITGSTLTVRMNEIELRLDVTGKRGNTDLGGGLRLPWVEVSDFIRFPGCPWGSQGPISGPIEEDPQPGSPREVASSAKISFGSHNIVPDALAPFLHEFGGVAAERAVLSSDSPMAKTDAPLEGEGEGGETQGESAGGELGGIGDRVLHEEDDEQNRGEANVLPYPKFVEKLKSSDDLMARMKRFINGISQMTTIAGVETEVHNFIDEFETRVSEHPLWVDLAKIGMGQVREGAEKFICQRIFPRVFAKLPEDLANDFQLTNHMDALQFVRPEHLDIPMEFHNEKSSLLAQSELRKMSDFKAPKDKMICVLNCCRVINNQISFSKKAAGADEFLPLLIYTVLKAQPPQLYSQLHFISRFRHPRHLSGEQAYFFTNMVSAVAFIEGIDSTSLSIDPEFFKSQMQQFHTQKAAREEAMKGPLSVLAEFEVARQPPPPQQLARYTGRVAELVGESERYANDVETVMQHAVEHKLSSLPPFKFVGRNAAEIEMGEIPGLLEDYHRLATLVEQLAVFSYVNSLKK